MSHIHIHHPHPICHRCRSAPFSKVCTTCDVRWWWGKHSTLMMTQKGLHRKHKNHWNWIEWTFKPTTQNMVENGNFSSTIESYRCQRLPHCHRKHTIMQILITIKLVLGFVRNIYKKVERLHTIQKYKKKLIRCAHFSGEKWFLRTFFFFRCVVRCDF